MKSLKLKDVSVDTRIMNVLLVSVRPMFKEAILEVSRSQKCSVKDIFHTDITKVYFECKQENVA